MQSQYQRLTDSQWEVVKATLPTNRKRKYSLRVITDAILWCLGSQWRNLPADGLSKWQVVHYYFRRWQADGTLKRLNWKLNCRERRRQGKQNTPSQLCIDSQLRWPPSWPPRRGWTATRVSTAASGT